MSRPWSAVPQLPRARRPARALLLTVLLVVTAVGPARAENLDDAFRLALDSDLQLRAGQQRSAAADARLDEAKAARLPSIEAQGAYYHLDSTPSTTLSLPPLPPIQAPLAADESTLYGVTGSLPLFTSGRISQGIRAARAAAGAEHASTESTAADVKLGTAEAYINVLRAQRLLKLALNSVETLSQHAGDAAALYRQGLVARNDALAAEVALANARQDQLRADNALQLARAAYNRATGRPLDAQVQIDELPAAPAVGALDDYTRRALAQRPELAALSQQNAALHAQARSVRAEQLPAVALSGGRYYLHEPALDDESYWSVAVSLRWTLFDGGQIASRAHALDRQAEASDDLRRDAETRIRLQVRQAWLDVEEARQRIAVADQARAQADENLRVARDRYTSGVGTNTEVLDAETLRVRSQTNYDNALYDNVFALERLRRASGDL